MAPPTDLVPATDTGHIRTGSIAGSPTEAEVAAIVAALEAVSTVVVVAEPPPAGPPPWRFSGRWWRRPVAARRERPW